MREATVYGFMFSFIRPSIQEIPAIKESKRWMSRLRVMLYIWSFLFVILLLVTLFDSI